MLYVREKIAKLGGVYLGGQVSNVDITEEAAIYEKKDDKGRIKATQPVGYEHAKVTIDIILEDTRFTTANNQLRTIQRLFKAAGQGEARLLKIVNEDCAARGISEVYFKSLTSKKVISESKRLVSLELIAPYIAAVKVIKKKKKKSSKKTKKTNKSKSKKNRAKTPAKDSRDTKKGKESAKKLVKK